MKTFQGLASATLIGSMPQFDRERAIGLILQSVPEIPVWPQLPAYEAEQMMVQYVEGLPGLVKEAGRQFVRTDTPAFEEETLHFFEDYLCIEAGSVQIEESRFTMGEESGATFRQFLQVLSSIDLPIRALKGQVVGPFTLLSGLKDQDGKALIFDERYLEIIPKLLALKARWQIEFLKPFGVPVIIFLDEPALAGFGSSAFITISSGLVREVLTEVVEAIHAAGGLAGIHVCANTDWLLAFQSDFDIINFDSYTYFDKFALYDEECLNFLSKGGNIAWGIVPTDPEIISTETAERLCMKWQDQMAGFLSGELPFESILSQSLFTPSCGCGSMPEIAAERVLRLLTECSAILKDMLRP